MSLFFSGSFGRGEIDFDTSNWTIDKIFNLKYTVTSGFEFVKYLQKEGFLPKSRNCQKCFGAMKLISNTGNLMFFLYILLVKVISVVFIFKPKRMAVSGDVTEILLKVTKSPRNAWPLFRFVIILGLINQN